MENKDKVISLFKFIQELSSLRYSKVTDITKQIWFCYLKDIPVENNYIALHYRDRVEEDSTADDVILKVRKPEFQACPSPEEIFSFWLNPGWDSFTNLVSIKDVLTPDVDPATSEHFEDNKDRVHAYEKWITRRNDWVEKQKIIDKIRKFFVRLYQLHVELERDSDTLELMVGEGILTDKNDKNTNHPILLRRLKTSFNPIENIIRFLDTDTESELYTMLIQDIKELNYSAVKTLVDRLYINDYHPLDRNDAHDFLKEAVHSLCPESKFLDQGETRPEYTTDRLFLTINPVFFVRKRIDGSQKAIDAIIQNIEDAGEIPPHIMDIVGGGKIEIPEDTEEPSLTQQLAAAGGEDIEILLSKEANKEQLEIAQRIALYNAVLVQGPPGTGKTHTIANLLGHFLANGNSVLVTSHTKKALSVLKEKISENLQNLCVSVLDDSNKDMERSIDGIAEYLSHYTSGQLKNKMKSAKHSREEIIKNIADVRQKIFNIKFSECSPIAYNGESISPSKVARFVCENVDELSYIPGKVTLYRPLPLTFEELAALYRSNESLSIEEERELACELPDPKEYFSPEEFRGHIDEILRAQKIINEIADNIQYVVSLNKLTCSINLEATGNTIQIVNPTKEALDALHDYMKTFPRFNPWMVHAAVDGRKGSGYTARWKSLISKITETVEFSDSIVEECFGKRLAFLGEDLSQFEDILLKMLELYKKKSKISKLDRLINKQIEYVEHSIKINDMNISSTEDCQLALHQIQLKNLRSDCRTYWNELLSVHGVPEFSTLSHNEPEQIAKKMINDINRYIKWYEVEYEKLVQSIEAAGMNPVEIFIQNQFDSDIVATEKILSSIGTLLPDLLKLSYAFYNLLQAERALDDNYKNILIGKKENSYVCNLIKSARDNYDCDLYDDAYVTLARLYEKYILQAQRQNLINKIYDVAPEWAIEISNRIGLHGSNIVPTNIADAWRWKQYNGILTELTSEPFEELQKQSVSLSKSYRETTANLAEWSAWYHLLKKTESNLDMRMALNGWKLTMRQIGRGTGKRAPMLKEEARKLMAQCQEAVPVWIITINKALESLVPGKNKFDVVIVDEASQSDISALAITYMAKKVIIVGDDKQVSPMAVGIKIDQMNALAEMYIKDRLPNWQLYTANSSLYDIASTVFQPLMLLEHFRCAPEIIGFSNKLSYNYKIKPLRDTSDCRILPSVVNFRTNGKRHEMHKTNLIEAKTIVSLIKACMEMEEYQGKTFGAISLLGNEQVSLFQKMITEMIDPIDIETRKISWGDSAHFQGDERDIVFLSLVDSNNTDGPLRLASEGTDQSVKKRYNVAASRAKDQLWVVHSLDVSKDLQAGDIRKEILDYSTNPTAFMELASQVEAHAESPFEIDVGKALVAKGYKIVQQWKVGAYRIDIVVVDGDKRVAIECDGERYHSGEEKVREDLERKTILERLGWRFINIRGSEYYRNPEKAMIKVFFELESLDIQPQEPDAIVIPKSSELLARVKERARQIFAVTNWPEIADSTIDIAEYMAKQASGWQKGKKPVKSSLGTVKSDTVQTISNKGDRGETSLQEPLKKDIKPNSPQEPQVIHHETKDTLAQKIINNLKIHKLEYIDNYLKSSIIWVIDKNGVKEILDGVTAQNNNVVYAFEKRGAIVTNNRAAWRINIK